MKKLFKIIIFLSFIFSFNLVSALEAPFNITLDKAWEDTLEISWEWSEWSEIYAVSYWEKSWIGWEYDNDLEIIVSETKTTIEKLSIGKKYFLAVKAYDSEETESEYSEEKTFSTLWELSSLKIEEITVDDDKTLNMLFNLELDASSNVNLNLINKNDVLNDIEVENYTIDWKKLKVSLVEWLLELEKYSVTVIELNWKNWEKIESWVDWIIEFEVPKDISIINENLEDKNLELEAAKNNEKVEENIAEPVEDNIEEPVKKVLWGQTIDRDDNKVIEWVAKNKEKLPTTWPAENLLFILFSIIAASMFFILRRKIKA